MTLFPNERDTGVPGTVYRVLLGFLDLAIALPSRRCGNERTAFKDGQSFNWRHTHTQSADWSLAVPGRGSTTHTHTHTAWTWWMVVAHLKPQVFVFFLEDGHLLVDLLTLSAPLTLPWRHFRLRPLQSLAQRLTNGKSPKYKKKNNHHQTFLVSFLGEKKTKRKKQNKRKTAAGSTTGGRFFFHFVLVKGKSEVEFRGSSPGYGPDH